MNVIDIDTATKTIEKGAAGVVMSLLLILQPKGKGNKPDGVVVSSH